jgi:hypothetical protein
MNLLDMNMREELAKAIYNTHRREDGPIWENLPYSIRDWVRAQAKTVESFMLKHLQSESK